MTEETKSLPDKEPVKDNATDKLRSALENLLERLPKYFDPDDTDDFKELIAKANEALKSIPVKESEQEKTKHTPGPWKVESYYQDNHIKKYVVQSEKNPFYN